MPSVPNDNNNNNKSNIHIYIYIYICIKIFCVVCFYPESVRKVKKKKNKRYVGAIYRKGWGREKAEGEWEGHFFLLRLASRSPTSSLVPLM